MAGKWQTAHSCNEKRPEERHLLGRRRARDHTYALFSNYRVSTVVLDLDLVVYV